MLETIKLDKAGRLELQTRLSEEGFNQIRCSNCGRFIGYEKVENGVILLKCHNCKMWSQISSAEPLTNSD